MSKQILKNVHVVVVVKDDEGKTSYEEFFVPGSNSQEFIVDKCARLSHEYRPEGRSFAVYKDNTDSDDIWWTDSELLGVVKYP